MLVVYPIFFILPVMSTALPDCSKESYDKCIRIGDPLIKQPHLIFPDNMADIDIVCRTWNDFVDCLKDYTEHCFTDQQRRQFNKAVENPIESVHQMCMQPSYQKEYLQYAPCIKSTITERIHCGGHYDLLVDQVSQGDVISKSTLCCSHDRFKQCVLKETRRLCDRGVPDGPALRFSSHLIEKALSFLQEQCYNYIPNSGDCNSLTTNPQTFTDPLTISTSPSEVYPWSTIQDVAGKEILPSRVTPPKTTTSWLPSSSLPIQTETSSSSQMLGSRTRPASFGRANSWSESSPVASNTVQMYPEMSSTQSSRPDWATMSSWNPPRLPTEPDKMSTTWYPAAGSQLVNEVDEPNQQGWSKPKNGAGRLAGACLEIIGIVAIMMMLC